MRRPTKINPPAPTIEGFALGLGERDGHDRPIRSTYSAEKAKAIALRKTGGVADVLIQAKAHVS